MDVNLMEHKEHTKDVQGWGEILLKIKSKKVKLEDQKEITLYYMVKEIDDGRSVDLKKVVKESMDKSLIEGIFKKRKKELEKKEFDFKEFKNLIEKFESEKHS
jgi:hypothetical protein